MSDLVKSYLREQLQSGKKINVHFNYNLTEKIKVVRNVMIRLLIALKDLPSQEAEASTGMSLLKFISVCRQLNKGAPTQAGLNREKILKSLHGVNEGKSHCLVESVKAVFARCVRLFFFFQRKDAYETLLIHDYGFYKFESFRNYLANKEEGLPFLQPIFRERAELVEYDESH